MNNFAAELQVGIDDMMGCPGNCKGCVLSSIERRSADPDMARTLLDTILDKLEIYSRTLKLNKLNITYGVADHGLLETDYLLYLYKRASNIILKANLIGEYSAVLMTFSLIGKPKHVQKSLNALKKAVNETSHSKEVPFYPIVVLDPKLLENKSFAQSYLENLQVAQQNFKKVDLAINLSDDTINQFSPQDLFSFAQKHQFEEAIVNLLPTFDNLKYTYVNNDKMLHWLIEYDKLVQTFKTPTVAYSNVLKEVVQKSYTPDQESLLQHIDNIFPEVVKKSLQFDNLGNIFTKFDTIGDIPQHPRFGLPAIGSILGQESIEQLLDLNEVKIKKIMFKELSYKPCQECKYQKACAMTGFHVFNHILYQSALKQTITLQPDEQGCVHVGRGLFAHFDKALQKNK